MLHPRPRRRTLLRTAAIAVFGTILISPFSVFAAESANMSAQEAHARQQAGELILVDVRTPPEWAASGIAEGALTINMQDPTFLEQVVQLRVDNPDKQIGFICASSNRSGQVQTFLAENGYPEAYSVFGGMNGNGQVPGWIAEDLPVIAWSE